MTMGLVNQHQRLVEKLHHILSNLESTLGDVLSGEVTKPLFTGVALDEAWGVLPFHSQLEICEVSLSSINAAIMEVGEV